MINLIFKNIVDNSNRIDNIVKHVSHMDKKYMLLFGLVILDNYAISKKISKLENEIKEMKSKGE